MLSFFLRLLVSLSFFLPQNATFWGLNGAGSSSSGISLDNSNSGGALTGSSTSFNFAVGGTCATNLALIVTVAVSDSGTPFDISGVTYNSVSMSQYSDNEIPGERVAIYTLAAPATGTHAVATSLAGSPSVGSITSAISLCGVSQSTVAESGATNTNTGTALTVNFSTLTAGAWYVAVGGLGSATTMSSVNDGATVITNSNTSFGGSNGSAADYKGPIATAGSVTPSMTAAFTGPWIMNGASIKP